MTEPGPVYRFCRSAASTFGSTAHDTVRDLARIAGAASIKVSSSHSGDPDSR
jgi:hypothetical protein